MQIHLLSSQSSTSQAGVCRSPGPTEIGTGHPVDLPEDLSAALREHGHRVEVDLLGDALHGHELTSLREGATAGRKIAARLTEAGSVLHALDTAAWAAALTARSLTDVSVVLRFSEPAADDGGLPRVNEPSPGLGSGRVSIIGSATERRAYRACLRAADAIAATDDGNRLAAVRAGVPDARTLIVPDVVGLPTPACAPAVRPQGQILLSLCGAGPGSGIETLLAALTRLPDRELVVVGPGGGADRAGFSGRLHRLDLMDRVRWLERVDRAGTARLIDAAALVVLPGPAAEVTAAIQAMTRSRAVVTVDGAPAAGAVVDGVTGSVRPAGRPDLLGQAIRALLNNSFQLEAMGLAGRERALTRYAQERAISATERAYRVALGAA
jgi:glycosyltransferase involved in cell wall biosynthesis